jgi:hypothetical protein
MELSEIIKQNRKSIINNFVIYTSDSFKTKWCEFNIDRIDNYLAKQFLLDLVDEVKSINKNLLKSLFIFSQKKNILYLSNLIYQFDCETFDDPLRVDLSNSTNPLRIDLSNSEIDLSNSANPLRSKPINIPICQRHHQRRCVVSSCFTPPDFSFNGKSWSNHPFSNLDEVLSYSSTSCYSCSY